MYLAHHALLLGHQYKHRLPQALRDNTITTVDLAQQLRRMATSTFLKAMQWHRASIIDTLRESAGKSHIKKFMFGFSASIIVPLHPHPIPIVIVGGVGGGN